MGHKKTCPVDGKLLEEISDCGIVDYDGNWDAQATRFDCPDGHSILVVNTDSIVEPGEPAFEAAETAIRESLESALWETEKEAKAESKVNSVSNVLLMERDVHGHEDFGPTFTSLEDLRGELARRAVEAFKAEAEENPDGHNYENVEYEFIHAIEDVDEILEEDEFKKELKEMGWLVGK